MCDLLQQHQQQQRRARTATTRTATTRTITARTRTLRPNQQPRRYQQLSRLTILGGGTSQHHYHHRHIRSRPRPVQLVLVEVVVLVPWKTGKEPRAGPLEHQPPLLLDLRLLRITDRHIFQEQEDLEHQERMMRMREMI